MAVRYSAGLAERVLEAARAGWSLYRIQRQGWAPSERTLQRWLKARPDFALALEAARTEGREAMAAAGRRGGRFGAGKWSAEVEAALVSRLAGGRALADVCRDADMPSQAVAYRWMKVRPGLRERVESARHECWAAMGGGAGRPRAYDAAVAEALLGRLAAGEPLRRICAGAGMPAVQTVHNWRLERGDFARAYEAARDRQAETLGEEVIEIADGLAQAGRGGADLAGRVAVARVRIEARKWFAASLSCRAGRTPAPEAAMTPEERKARIRELLIKGGYVQAGEGEAPAR